MTMNQSPRLANASHVLHVKYMITLCSLCIFIMHLSGCAFLQPDVATVWTNIPEITAYAEIYNAQEETVRINMVYREHPGHIPENTPPPDIIIGPHLNSLSRIPMFMSLSGLFKEDGLRKESFYDGVLSLGEYEENIVLLPISFNIEGLMIKKGDSGIPSTLISLEQMRALSAEYNTQQRSGFQTMGFSPAWTPGAGMLIARLMNVDFRENAIGTLLWNEEALTQSIEYASSWITDSNGGFIKDQEFIQKYLYDPGHKLLNTQPPRIRFYPTTLRTFARLPSQDRDPLDILWLQHEEKIEALEDIVYAGILRQSRVKPVAREFISWLASEQTQKMLLESTRFKRIRTFGIANGLSTLISINENTFPRFYPFLVGRIPPAKYIHFPKALPVEWPRLAEDVIRPWIQTRVSRETPPDAAPLSEEIRKWYLQQPDF
ncbi:MAG: hypothetical protein JXB03_06905 [Spirochaetales bacterium]|nr:hypothetical protein [Spirochaetales bacterium]